MAGSRVSVRGERPTKAQDVPNPRTEVDLATKTPGQEALSRSSSQNSTPSEAHQLHDTMSSPPNTTSKSSPTINTSQQPNINGKSSNASDQRMRITVSGIDKKKVSRSLGYSHFEDECLCKIYIKIAQDPNTGANQSVDRFWSRVKDAYNSSINDNWEKRSKRSLQCRMQIIEKAVKKLKGCVRQVKNYNPSGSSDQDTLNRANRMLMDDPNYKKGFKFHHVWDMMKNFEKFKDHVVTRRQFARKHLASYLSLKSDNPTPKSQANYPTPESQIHASRGLSQFPLNMNDVGGSSFERLGGIKKAELKKKFDEKFSSIINRLQEENHKILEMLEKFSVDRQHQLELQRRNLALKEKKLEVKILMQDLNVISDLNIRAYVQAQQAQILQKRGHFQ